MGLSVYRFRKESKSKMQTTGSTLSRRTIHGMNPADSRQLSPLVSHGHSSAKTQSFCHTRCKTEKLPCPKRHHSDDALSKANGGNAKPHSKHDSCGER